MRRCYLVCYDVRDPKRLRRTHKVMKAYGEAWQYSVVYCTLKPIDRVRLENDLREVLNLKMDQVLIVDLGSNEEAAWDAATTLGPGLPELDAGPCRHLTTGPAAHRKLRIHHVRRGRVQWGRGSWAAETRFSRPRQT